MALVLIIDDSWLQRMNIGNIIKEGGYETIEAPDGKEGINLIDSRKPDCVILDLLMPEMDGIEVLKTLGDKTKGMPVIVVTADIQSTTRQQCLELGASEIINKPPKKEYLLEVIEKHLKAEEA